MEGLDIRSLCVECLRVHHFHHFYFCYISLFFSETAQVTADLNTQMTWRYSNWEAPPVRRWRLSKRR